MGKEPIAWAVARKGEVGILVAFKTKEEAEQHIHDYESPYLEVREVYAFGKPNGKR